MTELSVVLISKNQEWNIARLIESVLRETAPFASKEIVLVDSASTDRTTDIAARYPIVVLKLHPCQRLTAAAGRYVGYRHTQGDLVLFLDGDMELCEGWLRQAAQVIRSRPEVAVVCGRVIDRPLETPGSGAAPVEPALPEAANATDVLHGGGAALYRRAVLELVGTFNPYLYSDEEPELCLRIRHAGYRVLKLAYPIAFHYTAPAEDLSTFLGKRKGNLWFGYGQNMRYFFGSPLLWPYLRERGWAAAPAALLIAGLAALVAGLTGQWTWLALWAACVLLLVIGLALLKHSLKRALLILLRRLFILDGTVRGLLLKPDDPAGYPGVYDVIH